ncbi:MAG: LysR family transcriptional regulator [Lachnospiraceae bacterium]|nr:LysR family transcriptional regulator [Lachnospiraceae bacterium]
MLEEELGVTLFIREKRRLHLTEEGLILKNRGAEILTLVEKTEDEIREYRHGVSGPLYIASVEGQGPYLMSRWIAGFCHEYPDVKYSLWNGSGDDAIERLLKRLCDFALLIEPFDHESLGSIAVGSEPWVAMIPGSHPLAKTAGNTVPLRELVGVPLIISACKSRSMKIHDMFASIGETPTVLCELSHYLNAYELVKQEVGVAIFPRSTGANFESSDVIIKDLTDPGYIADYVLVWNRKRRLSTAAEKFIEYVRKISE